MKAKKVLILILVLAFLIAVVYFFFNDSFTKKKTDSSSDKNASIILADEFGITMPYSAKVLEFEKSEDETLAKVIIDEKDIDFFLCELKDYKNQKSISSVLPSVNDSNDWWNFDANDVKDYYLKFYTKEVNGELCRGGELSIIILNKKDNSHLIYFKNTF